MPPRAASWGTGAAQWAAGPRPPTIRPAAGSAPIKPVGGGIKPGATPLKPVTGAIKPGTAPLKPAIAKPGAAAPKPAIRAPTPAPGGARPPGASMAAAGGLKRPGAPEGAVGPAAKKPTPAAGLSASAAAGTGASAGAEANKDGAVLTVTTQSTKDEIGIQTLVGDYAAKGTNHERKYYQKVQKIAGHENIKVFLYYWDARDGPDFCGWWFGDEIGGSQVWARSNSHGTMPPRIGWKIPWDAPKAEPGILLVDPYSGGSRASSSSAGGAATTAAGSRPAPSGGAAATPASAAARVKRATEQVTEMEASVKEALANSKATCTPQADEAALKEVQEALQQQQTSLLEVQKTLTTDINEARKGGTATTSSVTELSKLSPRVRTVQASLSQELTKVKGLVQRATTSAANAKKQAETQEQQKKAEEKDSQELQETLPAAIELVTASEDVVESVALMAAPLIAEPPDDQSDVLKMAMEEIETAAADGQNKITEARKQINLKLTGARKYAPETRKKALTEYSTLQQKLTDAQKKLNPYKSFRKEFASRVAAKKALTEITDKISSAELEVEKATMTTRAADQGQMSEDEVNSAEEMIKPAQQGITAALRIVEQKLRGAEGAMKDELNEMKDRGNASRKKLDSVVSVLKRQREGLSAQQVIVQATEEVGRAEDSLLKCQEAEMPFLKGLEVLPPDESQRAISSSETAAAAAEKAVNTAKVSIRTKLAEAKKWSKETSKGVTDELNELMKRMEAVTKKLQQFKQETSERKMASLLAEVVDSVTAAEKKVTAMVEVAQVFTSEELEKVSTEGLKEAGVKVAEAEKEAAAAFVEARKTVATKQREAKGNEATQAIAKLQQRLSTAHQEMAKAKKAASTGEKLIKGKEILLEQDAKIVQAEEEVEKAEAMSLPREDLGEERLSDERIAEMLELADSSQKLLKALNATVAAHLSGAVPPVKVALEKLKERTKKAQDKLNAVFAKTKDQREKVQCENALKEAAKKTEDVEAALEKTNDAELPFLKGIEVLPLTVATETIKESEMAAAAAQAAISQARTFIAAKSLEVKSYAAAVSKPAVEEFSKLTERINTAASKLSTFRKDTDGRKKTAQVQETSEKITAVDAQVAKLIEAVEPLLKEEESGPLPDEEAFALLEKISTLSTEATAAMNASRVNLGTLAADTKSSETHKEAVQKMTTQLAEVGAELAKAKKLSNEHGHKYTAKKLLQEAAQKVSQAEEKLQKSKETSAPLVEEGGEKFLVQNSVQALAAALRDHMKESGTTEESLFGQIGGEGQDDKIAEEAFVTYLEKLPDAINRDELQFNEARRTAIFKCIDADQDGFINMPEFKEIFRRRFVCVKGISVTDSVDVAKSKTMGKIEPHDVVEAIANPQTDEATGMTRLECKSVSSDLTGFVTMMGNQGSVYLEPYMPYTAFTAEMDKELDEGVKSVMQALGFLKAKEGELAKAGGKTTAATEARTEMGKARSTVSSVLASFEALKKKAQAAKTEFLKKEQAEKNAHVEARDKKQAKAISAEAGAKMKALEECAKQLEEKASTLNSLDASSLETFAEPASLLEEAEALLKEVQDAMTAAKACIKEQVSKLAKNTKGPLLEAKKEMGRLEAKAGSISVSAKTLVEGVRSKCQTIVDAKYGQVASALRAELQKRDMTVEGLYEQLAGSEGSISEEAFCSHLSSVDGLDLQPEHAKLVCRRIDSGGVGRRKFCAFLQQYFVVVKGIAITNDFDVGKAKTIRKVEMDELIEVIEGPCTDQKLGLTRIRGKSLVDGTEGWISVRGNQGTPFLKEAPKPYFYCAQEMPLEQNFKNEGEDPVRTVKVDEILELVEGPKKESFEPALRVRGKANSDGASGWFTMKDKKGVVFAEADAKFYTCSQSVAMTDNLDIKDCKVIRKLAVGETFTLLEGPVDEAEAGISRVKGKASKDDQEGWVTIKGNAGTVYASTSSKYYNIVREVPLQKKFGSSSEVIRELAKDETLQALEEPKEEQSNPEVRAKAKALSDGAVGWITVKAETTKKWTPMYKCLKAVPLHSAVSSEEATVVRQLEAGEKAELQEGPVVEGETLRMKARAEKDGALGWVSIREGEGKRFMQPVA